MSDADREAPSMPVERPATLYVNDEEVVTLQTTPEALDDWAVGFLYGEGLIQGTDDIAKLSADEERGLIWVDLSADGARPRITGRQRYLTAGCGKGVTFSSLQDAMQLKKVTHGLQIDVQQILGWIKQMQANTPLYRETGGVHAAALVDVDTGQMIIREDIGRHNALDKAIGAALRVRWPFERVVALSSGRLSYEAAIKLGRAGIGISATLTAATDQSVRLARHLGIDLIGYARSPRHMVVYTAGSRILQ